MEGYRLRIERSSVRIRPSARTSLTARARFKSPIRHSGVAQSVERDALNVDVDGSTPSTRTPPIFLADVAQPGRAPCKTSCIDPRPRQWAEDGGLSRSSVRIRPSARSVLFFRRAAIAQLSILHLPSSFWRADARWFSVEHRWQVHRRSVVQFHQTARHFLPTLSSRAEYSADNRAIGVQIPEGGLWSTPK